MNPEEINEGEIRHGFANGKFYTSSPKSKKYSGGFWRQNILQIFEKETDKLVENVYYCNTCDELIFCNGSGGTAKINRYVSDHLNSVIKIKRVDMAEMLHKACSIAVQYGEVFNTQYFLDNFVKPKQKWYE